MKISKKKLGDICAEVSAQNVAEAANIAESKGSKNHGKIGIGKLLMDVLIGKRLIDALGFEDEDTEVEITKEMFSDATQKAIEKSADDLNGEAGLIMMLESVLFTSMLEERLFGEETKDEA